MSQSFFKSFINDGQDPPSRRSFFKPVDLMVLALPICVLTCTVLTAIFSFHFHFRQIITTTIMLVWSGRLLVHLLWRARREPRDDRFDSIRGSWWKRGLYLFLQDEMAFSYTMLFTTILSIRPEYQGGWGIFDMLGLAFALLGLITTIIADHQLRLIKQSPDYSTAFLCTGMWKVTRHPNYMGELLFAPGMFLMSVSTLTKGEWVGILAPIYLILMLRFVSGVRPAEKSMKKLYSTCPEYLRYVESTGLVFPKWSFRRRTVLHYEPQATTEEQENPIVETPASSTANLEEYAPGHVSTTESSPLIQDEALHSPYVQAPSSSRNGYSKLPTENVHLENDARGISTE
ncbi:putative 3-oxo-5-alpha-steroid 4-dehydrogenase 1 [Blattamonas nauphoetae]|uniref:3-oxo-5-alpha-steroid 4-dehydrogenase 1 n=1 Tax=Blattamonas nauphoetae TaxID=2049346 RepID=A0ABQ9XCF0_9EUKA|nr:putative 3-oxo-5-alpha-steroid 4-dehydrogenase 1 [Blattamonas nauphoetae]